MSKRKDRTNARRLFESVVEISETSHAHGDGSIPDDILAQSEDLFGVLAGPPRELTKMKKFRFQLLHRWMVEQLAPCRVADIGGGKGLLTYLLNQSGWQATVIDPVHQALPAKYKNLESDRQIHIAADEVVPRRDQPFAPDAAQDFDLLIALHAHGCNIALIDAAARWGCGFVMLPCCVLDEPLHPPPGTHWLQCVADYAKNKGFAINAFRLNFKGQNIGLYAHKLRQADQTAAPYTRDRK